MRVASVKRNWRACRRCLCLLFFFATLVAPTLAAGTEPLRNVERVFPPGDEERLAEMLGRGAALPGDCRFAGGHADGAIVTAEYACGDAKVVFELRHPDNAPPTALRTEQFAIVARSGSAPPGLSEALAALIRAHESGIKWRSASRPTAPPSALAAGACGIVVLGLAAQYLLGRRPAPLASDLHPSPPGAHHLPTLLTLGLVAAFLLTRLPGLTRLPVFIDESIHIAWARAPIGHDLIGEISVGKWLPVYIMSLFALLPLDPLFCARLASVSMGLATLIACVLINRQLFSATEGLLAGLIYTILPFTLLYDRLALADIYVTAFSAWVLVYSLSMARYERSTYPVAMCLATYAAILSKPTGGLALATPLLVGTLLVRSDARIAYLKRVLPTLISGSLLLAFLLGGGYGTNLITSQSTVESRDLLRLLLVNLELSRQWFTALLTPMVAFAALAALVWASLGIFTKAKPEALLAALFLLAFAPYVLVSKAWFPRYLLVAVVPISLLLSRAIVACASVVSRVAQKLAPCPTIASPGVLLTILTLPFVVSAVRRDLVLITEPEDADLPPADRTQYISGWTSGYGLPELAEFLRRQAEESEINIVRLDLAEPPHQSLDVYLTPTQRMRMYTVDHLDDDAAAQIRALAEARRTLFIVNAQGGESEGVTMPDYVARSIRIWQYVRPDSQSRLELWEVLRPQE